MSETTSRVLALLSLLQSHRQWAGPDLAARLDVTDRTLRRDIERLRELGYRIETTRGAAGGYRLEAGSELPPLLLSDDEAVAMAIGLRVTASTGLDDGEQTSLSALAKFEQVLPAALRERVNALAAVVELRAPGGTPVASDLLGQLALACRDRERIRFRYRSGTGDETSRVVEPSALVSSTRRWFLLAWDRERCDWRTFRVDRMSELFHTRVLFDERELPAASAAEFVSAALSGFAQRHTAEIVLSIPLDDLRERFGTYASRARRHDDDHSVWPIYGDTPEAMLASVAWIPSDVEYRIEADAGFLALARSAGERLLRAVDVPAR